MIHDVKSCKSASPPRPTGGNSKAVQAERKTIGATTARFAGKRMQRIAFNIRQIDKS